MNQNNQKYPVFISTRARGGMKTVVDGYMSETLLDDWRFKTIWTHDEGSIIQRLRIATCAWFKFTRLLVSRKISFAHIHSAMKGSFWRKTIFAQTARLFKVPVIMHLHGSEMQLFYNNLTKYGKWLVRWSLESSERVVVLSDSWKVFINNIAPNANVMTIPNYVRPPERLVYKCQPEKFEVLFLGLIGNRKGIFDVISIWPEILKQIPYARLLIGGNGEIDRAHDMIKELGISESVNLLGWIDGQQKYQLIANSDVFVLPSYNEGLPMSVLEAMSFSRAVISSNVGGIPELIHHNVDGFIINPGDKKNLLDYLSLLATDGMLREQIAAAAREKIESKYSNTAVIPKLDRLYNDIIS